MLYINFNILLSIWLLLLFTCCNSGYGFTYCQYNNCKHQYQQQLNWNNNILSSSSTTDQAISRRIINDQGSTRTRNKKALHHHDYYNHDHDDAKFKIPNIHNRFMNVLISGSIIILLSIVNVKEPAYAQINTVPSTIETVGVGVGVGVTVATPSKVPTSIVTTSTILTNDIDENEGVPIITDSSLGKAIRKSTIQGARIIDNFDEKWERFSDSLRDQRKCDEATGRRLYDNGFRKDGTRVGNPVLGSLCNPIELEPFNDYFGDTVLENALDAAVKVHMSTGTGAASTPGIYQNDMSLLKQNVQSIKDLVRPSFERSINNDSSSSNDNHNQSINSNIENEKKRKLYNFATYATMKGINNDLNSSSEIKKFYLSWGESLVTKLAPNANRKDYESPFPEIKDEFEDYDYDKDVLLDSLGMLNVALKSLQKNGLIGHYEISIPYDDYGSVVTLAVDDDITLGSQLLLREQGMKMSGSFVESMVRYVMDKAKIQYSLDSFFIDPSTTKQSEYNPTQLLLSLSNLRIND